MTEADVAWAAGLFEGEGAIFLERRAGKRTRMRLSLMVTDHDVIQRFAAIVGGPVRGPYRQNTRRKPIWNWQVGRACQVQQILRDLWPYLGERRRARAAEVLAMFYEGRD